MFVQCCRPTSLPLRIHCSLKKVMKHNVVWIIGNISIGDYTEKSVTIFGSLFFIFTFQNKLPSTSVV